MIDHVWHWQQIYLIVMWTFSAPMTFLSALSAGTSQKRLERGFSFLVILFSIYVIWSGGFFG